MPEILVLRKICKEDCEFEANMVCIIKYKLTYITELSLEGGRKGGSQGGREGKRRIREGRQWDRY